MGSSTRARIVTEHERSVCAAVVAAGRCRSPSASAGSSHAARVVCRSRGSAAERRANRRTGRGGASGGRGGAASAFAEERPRQIRHTQQRAAWIARGRTTELYAASIECSVIPLSLHRISDHIWVRKVWTAWSGVDGTSVHIIYSSFSLVIFSFSLWTPFFE
jgi:hypothetical protein